MYIYIHTHIHTYTHRELRSHDSVIRTYSCMKALPCTCTYTYIHTYTHRELRSRDSVIRNYSAWQSSSLSKATDLAGKTNMYVCMHIYVHGSQVHYRRLQTLPVGLICMYVRMCVCKPFTWQSSSLSKTTDLAGKVNMHVCMHAYICSWQPSSLF
jgi:hypothetical protein